MIKLDSLTIGYQQKNNQKIVAEHISAEILPGQLTCLIGPNGVGKSTLLKTLSAFLPSLDGDIYLGDKRLSKLTDRELSRKIGVVLTMRPEIQNMTVFELISLGRSPYTGFWGRLNEDDKAIVKESLRWVGIEHLRNRMVQNLSDGERQKMMIAKALAQQTPVIYLDEPTAFLDYPSKVDMLQLLHRLSRETQKTIFLSTHDIELALQIADTLWLMQPGKTISIGSPRELADNGSLGHFLNRPGIHFDVQTMNVKVIET
ncbi:MAG: ABC transporter ATP-binding protein [Prevotella sp.]|nr:ABC transporter ATP-binding protein [Prevotella sp.]